MVIVSFGQQIGIPDGTGSEGCVVHSDGLRQTDEVISYRTPTVPDIDRFGRSER
jgi:hypothetical protein